MEQYNECKNPTGYQEIVEPSISIWKVIGAGLCFFSALLMASLFMWVM